MTKVPAVIDRCLNCESPLNGAFCASCGQRAVPPNPTVAELTGDAWEELSGYDGRILATLRGLILPGRLTNDYAAGRRAHYLPPLRVYLTVSVLYFVVAASAPVNLGSGGNRQIAPGVRIQVNDPLAGEALGAEEIAQLRGQLDQAPWILRPMLEAVVDDPAGFRARVFTTMPRVLFGMLPIFAAIVSLFYRGRTFPTAMVFAAHLHSFAFVALTVSEIAKFSYSIPVTITLSSAVMLGLAAYTLTAFRRVYGGSWLMVIVKSGAIAVLYMLASVPALILMLVWVAW